MPTNPWPQTNMTDALPYSIVRDLGFPMLPPPHVLAPTVMSPPVPPAPVAVPYPVAYPYPLPGRMMPPLPPAPAVAPIRPQAEAPVKLPEMAKTKPEIISLSGLANDLESTNPARQKEAMAGLQKLLSGNPDFKNPKPGSVPEAMLIKALKNQDELFLGEFLGQMASETQSLTPRLRRALRQIQTNNNVMPPTRQLAAQLAQGPSGQGGAA